jgi:hypothetical protein
MSEKVELNCAKSIASRIGFIVTLMITELVKFENSFWINEKFYTYYTYRVQLFKKYSFFNTRK